MLPTEPLISWVSIFFSLERVSNIQSWAPGKLPLVPGSQPNAQAAAEEKEINIQGPKGARLLRLQGRKSGGDSSAFLRQPLPWWTRRQLLPTGVAHASLFSALLELVLLNA